MTRKLSLIKLNSSLKKWNVKLKAGRKGRDKTVRLRSTVTVTCLLNLILKSTEQQTEANHFSLHVRVSGSVFSTTMHSMSVRFLKIKAGGVAVVKFLQKTTGKFDFISNGQQLSRLLRLMQNVCLLRILMLTLCQVMVVCGQFLRSRTFANSTTG